MARKGCASDAPGAAPVASPTAELPELWPALIPGIVFLAGFAWLPVALLFAHGAILVGGPISVGQQLLGPSLAAALARQAIENSLLQGSASSVLALALGYPAGLFLGRFRFRGRDTLLAFLLVPFLLPVIVVVLGIQELFGRGGVFEQGGSVLGSGLPGILVANVYYNAPIVALFTSAAIENRSSRLEDAVATLGGGPFRVFREVWGRASLVGGGAGALVTFLLSFQGFAAPLILGGPTNFTVSVWVYALAHEVYASIGPASVLAFWSSMLLALPAVLYVMLVRAMRPRSGGGSTPPRLTPFNPRRLGQSALAVAALALSAMVVSLLTIVLILSFRLPGAAWGTANWTVLFGGRVTETVGIPTTQAVVNSLFFAGLATATVLGLVVLLTAVRTPARRARGLLDLGAFFPVLVSPVILAFALRDFWGTTLGTPSFLWILIVASQAALALPFVAQSTEVALRAVPANLNAAARTIGASPWQAFRDIDLPLLRPALISGTLFAAALSLGEFAATNFLYIPTYATMVVELYLLGQARLLGAVSALGALLVLVSLLLFGLLAKGAARVRL